MTADQLAFDLPVLASHSAEDFIVSDCNRDAAALIEAWPDWPAHAVVLAGPAAAGKSHLAGIWAERAKAQILVPPLPGAPPAGALVVEDIGAADEERLLHIHNWTREQGMTLLMTADCMPARMRFTLPDLTSRLQALPVARIEAPDDALLLSLLAKQFSDRQIRVAPEVLTFAVRRMERSFAAARAFVARCDALALRKKRSVTKPLAREALETLT